MFRLQMAFHLSPFLVKRLLYNFYNIFFLLIVLPDCLVTGKPSYLTEPQYVAVTRFLELIPQNLLADACHACRAYTRALMHLEHFLSSKGQNLQDHLDFMQVHPQYNQVTLFCEAEGGIGLGEGAV